MKQIAFWLLVATVKGELPSSAPAFRSFGPRLSRQEVYGAPPATEAPYPPSGWKPSGQELRLPFEGARVEQGVPHTVYGPPSSTTAAPDNQYGAPQQPDNSYGPPPPEEPQNNYGPPDNTYGPPNSEEPNGNAGPQEPDSGYGAPEQPQEQEGGYQYPPPQQPDNSYGAPPEQGTGQIPVEQGAAEKLRESQFFQQLPAFDSSKFRKMQQLSGGGINNRFGSIRQQAQRFTSQSNRNQSNGHSNAVSGEYYVLEPRGRLQRVSYTTKNGKLVNGKITSGIKVESVQSIDAPIYRVNQLNQLVRIN